MGDAFFQLAHIRQRKMLVQLGLAEQHNLHQLVVAGFQVGQQPDLLQGLQRHGMRLINQRHHLFALGVYGDQPFLQGADHFGGAAALGIDAQISGNYGEHFVTRQRGHGKVNCFHRGRQALHQHPAQHGLAGAHFARDFDHALTAGDGINQRFQRLAAVGTRKKELGMRGNFKRGFGQAEMFKIHRHDVGDFTSYTAFKKGEK